MLEGLGLFHLHALLLQLHAEVVVMAELSAEQVGAAEAVQHPLRWVCVISWCCLILGDVRKLVLRFVKC